MRTILVTGFSPFPGAPENPTEWLVERLRADPPPIAGATVTGEVLPVAFDRSGPALLRLIADKRPAAIIMFGLSARAKGFMLERVARNFTEGGRADNAGQLYAGGTIAPLGPDMRESTLPLAALHGLLSAEGLPVCWSDDAGGYLCNLVFYTALNRMAASGIPTGFIHVPYTDEQKTRLTLEDDLYSMPGRDLERGARLILEAVAEVA